jgi:diadenosine tetraphosphatase ApaH/serine/threonine PP2A family protein phosphatase
MQYLGGKVPDDVLDWMEKLPPYLYPSNQLDANGLRLLLSHTGYGLEADTGNWYQALWGRHVYGEGVFPDDGRFRVVGHTGTRAPILKEKFVYYDTGAAYGGGLTGFLWPSKTCLYQVHDETPVEPTFTLQSGGLIT